DRTELFSQLALSPRIRYVSFSILGSLYLTDNQFEQALKQYTKALDAIMETNDERTLVRRAALQAEMTQVHMSLKNWSQATELIETLMHDANQYQQRQYLPILHLWLGIVEAELKQYEQALNTNRKGLALAKEFNNNSLSLTFKNNLGSILIETEDYPAAQQILEEALGQAHEAGDKHNWHYINFNLGYIQVMLGNVDSGLNAMYKSLDFDKSQGNKIEYEHALEWLAKAYGAVGMYQQQAKTLLEQITLRKDIFNAERDKVRSELNSRFDTKAKTQQITILQQENDLKAQLLANQTLQKRITILFSLVLAFAGVMLFQLYRKVRMSNKRLREANKQFEFQSLRDPLTGLLNRRALQEHMQKRQDLARRHGDALPTGLLILDIDFFKNINDQYGHAAGDAVLIDISKR
ncbi:tetratricopeptide repeat-containing diguanylate cyclase, partial [Arsukibacterium sp.]|uniref:tetratricopeptide repeat-containing diguanylate cyclase n=1 Tax=Arsukibacterium sp. TaxID=1977258 RepID=UPI002FDB5053